MKMGQKRQLLVESLRPEEAVYMQQQTLGHGVCSRRGAGIGVLFPAAHLSPFLDMSLGQGDQFLRSSTCDATGLMKDRKR